MATREARQFTSRLGMRQYHISDEEFLNPGDLVDSIVDDEICRTGGFIARLATWTQEDGARNVSEVKDFINGDVSMNSFHPDWLTRKTLVHRTVFDINPIHDQTLKAQGEEERGRKLSALRRLQVRMRERVNDCAFPAEDDSGELSRVLKDHSLSDCIEVVMDNLEGKINDIVCLQNMTLTPPLNTTAAASMTTLKTVLERLSYKPLSGINQPTMYIGTEFSTFPCYREDMSSCAMNRHIAGAPKIWFCIPPSYYAAFIWMVQNLPIPEHQKVTVCHMLHKNLWLDPRLVLKFGIPVYPIIQRPGDIVFLVPNTIHWGLNINFNMNEAIILFVSPGFFLACCPTRGASVRKNGTLTLRYGMCRCHWELINWRSKVGLLE